MMPSNRVHQLKSRVRSPKYRKLKHESRGMYKVTCLDCKKRCIGETKILVSVRCWGEHEREAVTARKKNVTLKSMMARHIIEEGPTITWETVYVIKEWGTVGRMVAQQSLAILREPKGNRLNHNGGTYNRSF